MVAAAPPEAKAERAAFMAAKGRATGGAGDLVADVESGRVALAAVPEASMPEGLRGLDLAGRTARLSAVKKTREELLKKVSTLSKEREAYLERRATAASRDGESDGFDAAAKKSLRKTVADNPLSGLKL
jgi:hypothetical protein